jgi:hypothetical protein
MTVVGIFVLGTIVTVITGYAAFLVGLEEAADTTQSRVQDLTAIEKKIVGRGSTDD